MPLLTKQEILIHKMKSSKYLALTGSLLILPSMILALETQDSVLNATHTVFNVQQGMSVNISCTYNKSADIEMLHATLNTGQKFSLNNQNNTLWFKLPGNRNIRPIWTAETKEIAFELSNVQINNSGTYICTVERHVPPPVVILGTYITIVQTVARPNVSLLCVKEPDGFLTIQCISERFYPSDLQQVWMRNGEIQNISQSYNANTTNPDGSITLRSYLNVSSAISDYLNYSCWVNHSSLNKPVILHLSPKDCYESKDDVIYIIALVICALLTLIIFITAVVLMCFRRGNHRSPVSTGSVLHSHPQSTELIYSTLGNHRPVPCSSTCNQSLINTTSTLNTD